MSRAFTFMHVQVPGQAGVKAAGIDGHTVHPVLSWEFVKAFPPAEAMAVQIVQTVEGYI